MAKKKLSATNSIKRFIKKIGGKIVATNDDTQYTLLKRKSNSWNIDKDGVTGLMSDLGVGGGGSASEVSYDNSESGLTATTTQGAIDESVEALHSIDNALIVNNKHFYFDEHDGVLGMNTSELRGADTFKPFLSGNILILPSATAKAGTTPVTLLQTFPIYIDSQGNFKYMSITEALADLGLNCTVSSGGGGTVGYKTKWSVFTVNGGSFEIITIASGSTTKDTITAQPGDSILNVSTPTSIMYAIRIL